MAEASHLLGLQLRKGRGRRSRPGLVGGRRAVRPPGRQGFFSRCPLDSTIDQPSRWGSRCPGVPGSTHPAPSPCTPHLRPTGNPRWPGCRAPPRLTCCGGGRVYTGTVKAGLHKVAEGCGEQRRELGSHREQRPQLRTQGSHPPRENKLRAMHRPAPPHCPAGPSPGAIPTPPPSALWRGLRCWAATEGVWALTPPD